MVDACFPTIACSLAQCSPAVHLRLQTMLPDRKYLQLLSIGLLAVVVPLEELAIGIAAEADATTLFWDLPGYSSSAAAIIVRAYDDMRALIIY